MRTGVCPFWRRCECASLPLFLLFVTALMIRSSLSWSTKSPRSPPFILSNRSGRSFVPSRFALLSTAGVKDGSRKSRTASLTMRDRSSANWFRVGDTVQVIADHVEKSGINLQHRVGRVTETWEKCDVDPTCCCAEQVDLGMAIRVEFSGSLIGNGHNGVGVDDDLTGTSFSHYFAEEELIRKVDCDDCSQ